MDPSKFLTMDRARGNAGPAASTRFGADRAATREDTTKVYLYDVISTWWGVSAASLIRVLAEIDTPRIELHINSPGGDAYEGIAMANALRDHDAHVVAVVDGLAASAASMVIMGADEVVMAPNAELMIHEVWTFTGGSADELRADADRLDKTSTNYARAYAAKAGGSPEDWRALMKAETWYLDDEAVAAGLADRLASDADTADDADQEVPESTQAAAKDRWDLSMFRHAGRSDAPAPPGLRPAAAAGGRIPSGLSVARNNTGRPEALIPSTAPAAEATTPAASAPSGDTKKEKSMQLTDAQCAQLAQKVGVPADADANTLLAAVDEALAEQADDQGGTRGLAPGTRVIDEATYDDLLERAAAGDEARTAQALARRQTAVDTAINEGRIPPARRDHWLAQLEADEEGATTVLAQLAAGTIPLTEDGHADTLTESDEDSPEYAALYGPAKED